jgi:hypothetical protein
MSGLPRPQTHEAGRQDVGDLGQALGGGEVARVKGIGTHHAACLIPGCSMAALIALRFHKKFR